MRAGTGDFIAIKGVSKLFAGRNAAVQALNLVDLAVADGEFGAIGILIFGRVASQEQCRRERDAR